MDRKVFGEERLNTLKNAVFGISEKEVELKKLADKLVVVLKQLGKGEDAVAELLKKTSQLTFSKTIKKTSKTGFQTTPSQESSATPTTKTSLLDTWKMINKEYTGKIFSSLEFCIIILI
jgi:hypothetical protein